MPTLKNIPSVVIYRNPDTHDEPGAIFGPFSSARQALRWIAMKKSFHGWNLEFTVVSMISPDDTEDYCPKES